MGESITEGTILRWLKQPGDAIKKDEPILEISTDKVDTEVPAPVAGTLLQQVAQEKETVAVGALIAVIGEAGETAQAPEQKAASPAKEEAPKSEAKAPTESKTETKPAQESAPAKSGGEGQAVVMPKMGESITEGTILRWLKKEGDQVKKDEPIVEISTDKVDTEVPSPFAGTLTKISAQEKETIAVGATLGFIGGTRSAQPSEKQTEAPKAEKTPEAPKPAPVPSTLSVPAAQPVVGATTISKGSGNRFYSPLVRSIAKQEGISTGELDTISGSGLGGRVNKNDILGYIKSPRQISQQSAPSPKAKTPPPGPAHVFETDTIIPMDNIRQKTAEHMIFSKKTSAHVTSVTEVDMTGIVKFRERNKDDFKRREGVGLTYTPIMIEAMVKAIKDFPFINSSVDGTNIHVKKDINFGVAVSIPPAEASPLPPALIVPVIKKAQDLNYVGIAKAVADLAARARTKKLKPDDISGGTFTITNPGMYGNLFGTPIINQPQVAIMTTGAIVKRVIVITDDEGNDTMAIRSMMYLGLSYDHRIIDGMYGVQFTERVKYYLENFEG